MVRFLLRLVGLVLLAGAFAALVVDGTRSVAADAPAIMPLGRLIEAIAPALFVEAHATILSHAPLLWDPVLVTLLLLPSWLVLGGLGLAFLALGRRPAAKIGYSRR